MAHDIALVKKKISEAVFFLHHLQQEEHSSPGDQERFEFFLSAFLNAGRSVDYRLRCEFNPKYESWRDGWNCIHSGTDALLKFMHVERQQEVHAKGARYVDGQAERRVGPGQYPYRGGMAYISGPPGIETLATLYDRIFFFSYMGSDRPAVDLCAEYLQAIRQLVLDFEASLG